MNRLPQDLYEEIAAFLPGQDCDLPALATVSPPWQAAIERQTFKEIFLKSIDLDYFQEILSNSRRGYVNVIHYDVILPAYSDGERCRFEREDTRRTNDNVFTAAIHGLFSLLKSWDVYKDGYIELRLRDVYSNAEHLFLRHSSPSWKYNTNTSFSIDKNGDQTVDVRAWRFRYSFLRLLHASELPMVPVVRSFSTSYMTRNICDRVPIDMAARLPSLRQARWTMNNWGIRYIALHRIHRCDLAHAVAEFLPQLASLESLSLLIAPHDRFTPRFYGGSLNVGSPAPDTLSNAIRSATKSIPTLKSLMVVGTFDESLFWPVPTRTLPEPYWQKLESVIVQFSPRRPSGGSYFRGFQPKGSIPSDAEVPPGYKQSEQENAEAEIHFSQWDHFGTDGETREVAPDDDALEPFIEAFGRACIQMPMLKEAHLTTTIPAPVQIDPGRCVQSRFSWCISYLSPGTIMRQRSDIVDPVVFENIHQRRLIWDVMNWRPSHDLRALLRQIGSHQYGANLVEKFANTWGTVGEELYLRLNNHPPRR